MANHTSTTIAATSEVRHHTQHGDGRSSWRVGDGYPIDIYICGTPDELRDLGERLISEANHQRARILTRQGVAV